MPFRLSNALSAFQRFINEVFLDLLDICVVVIYLDNILIYSDDLEDHKKHVKEVLKKLWDNGLYVSSAKCVFHQRRVEFIDFVLSPKGIYMDTKKVQIIQDWPIPQWVKDVQMFIGFANFYRRFIKGYSEQILLLTQLTRKNEPWLWSTQYQIAFDSLKLPFTSAPILVHLLWEP